VAGLSTRVAEQLIPTWAKFNGKTTVLSPATLPNKKEKLGIMDHSIQLQHITLMLELMIIL
jgi:hypothetical protein